MEMASKAGTQIVCVRITDKIGREFKSDPGEMRLALKNAATVLRSRS